MRPLLSALASDTGLYAFQEIDKLRSREDSLLDEVLLNGKLLFATLLVKRSHRYFAADRLEPGREHDITPRRLWKALKDEAIALITCPLLKTGATQSGR